MQHRMKTHQLTENEIDLLLHDCQTGTLATINPNGTPYNVPVHYVFLQEAIYIHGLSVGQKIANIEINPAICFTVYKMQGILIDLEKRPCDTNTAYTSVIIQGLAQIIDNVEEKRLILSAFIHKYASQLTGREIPLNMLKSTAVIKINISQKTGKYYMDNCETMLTATAVV